MKRALAIGAVVAAALAIAAVVWLQHSLDGLVDRTIEQVGTELFGSRVSVEHARIHLRDGRATITGLEVANPAAPESDFSTEPALSLGEVAVEIDLAALDLAAVRAGAAPIPIALVRVAEPHVRAEASGGGLNLDRLRRNVREAAPSQDAQPQSELGAPIRIRIARLEFSGGQLLADATRVGGDVEQVEIPDFALEGIGGAQGATPAEIGKRVSDALLTRSIRAAALGGIGGEVERLQEKASEKLRGLFD